MGRAYSRNRGVKLVKSKYILFLDDDILIERLTLDTPEDVMVGKVRTLPLFRRDPSALYEEKITWRRKGYIKGASLFTSILLIKKTVFSKVGGFDEDFRKYGGEDTEFGIRLEKKGYRVAVKEIHGLHLSPPSIAERLKKINDYVKNGLKIIKIKHEDYIWNLHALWIHKGELPFIKKLYAYLIKMILNPALRKLYKLLIRYNTLLSYYTFILMRLSYIHQGFIENKLNQ